MYSSVRLAGIVVIVALVTGCLQTAPQYGDALADLRSAPSAGAAAPFKAGSSVAVVLGSNVDKSLGYNEDAEKAFRSMPAPLVNNTALKDADQQYAITSAIGILRRKYPNIVALDDLATASRRKIATTFVVDLKSVYGRLSGDTTVAHLEIIVLDQRQKQVSRLDAEGQAIIPYPAWTVGYHEAVDKALSVLQAKFDSLTL